jgi:hypothetical protein
VPELGHVHDLVEHAFAGRAFAEKAGGDGSGAQPLVGQGNARSEWDSASDDGVAAVEAARAVEQVHRSAVPTTAAFSLAEHLGHDGIYRHAARERVAVLAVGGNHGILRLQCRHHANGNRLFTIV